MYGAGAELSEDLHGACGPPRPMRRMSPGPQRPRASIVGAVRCLGGANCSFDLNMMQQSAANHFTLRILASKKEIKQFNIV